jgi:hypothetical protein
VIKQTHTYANLPVSEAAYREIKEKLQAAGYVENPEDAMLPMQGIALIPEDQADPEDIMEAHQTLETQAPSGLRKEIEGTLNKFSAENGSNTPDFILAQYLIDCLAAYDRAVMAREKWYGREPKPASGLPCGCEGGICEHQPPPDPVGKPFFTSI